MIVLAGLLGWSVRIPVRRGQRFLPRENSLSIHEVRIALHLGNHSGPCVAGFLVVLASESLNLTFEILDPGHRLCDNSLRLCTIHDDEYLRIGNPRRKRDP